MVRAVESLEEPVYASPMVFVVDSGKIPANSFLAQKGRMKRKLFRE